MKKRRLQNYFNKVLHFIYLIPKIWSAYWKNRKFEKTMRLKDYGKHKNKICPYSKIKIKKCDCRFCEKFRNDSIKDFTKI